jgi:hypothetical protein
MLDGLGKTCGRFARRGEEPPAAGGRVGTVRLLNPAGRREWVQVAGHGTYGTDESQRSAERNVGPGNAARPYGAGGASSSAWLKPGCLGDVRGLKNTARIKAAARPAAMEYWNTPV